MKNIKIKIVALFAASMLIFSCTKDDNTGISNFTVNSGINYTVDTSSFGANPTTTDEADVTYTYTVNLSGMQTADVIIPVSVIAGNATEGVDFDYDNLIVIPAGTTSKDGTFTVYGDILPEDTETFTLQIGNPTGVANVSGSPVEVTTTITNFTSGDLMLEFAWDKEVDVAGTTYDFTDIDFDFYVVDATFATPGVGGTDAATGASPEHMTLTGLADGTYYIFADKYTAPWDLGSLKIPTRVSFTKPGIFITGDVTQDPSYQFLSWQTSDGTVGTMGYVTSFEVIGGVYTIYDAVGNVFYQE